MEYVISGRALDHPKLSLVRNDGVYVYRNQSVLPRAFIVSSTENHVSMAEVAVRLRDAAFEPARTALLVDGPRLSRPADQTARTRILEYKPEHVRIDVSSAQEGLLVLADAWDAGWTATVDGVRAEILRTNLVLRGVHLPPGAHMVEFRYDPASFRAGLWISGGAAAFAAAWAGLALRRNRDGRRDLSGI